ncbi:MAG TPA: ribonuclease P protein component [Natronosporangium sp.]|jgi:ribonuclease P protein component|nr:ribonuclease P protein component [Natronosporangium sp.]
MLDRAHRLRRRDEFTAALREGRRVGRGTLVVHLRLTDASAPPRAGFIVSRAVGGAVVRNRVRRRLRHLVREHLSVLPNGALLVVRALPAAATARWADLSRDLAAALRTAVRRELARHGATARQEGGKHE